MKKALLSLAVALFSCFGASALKPLPQIQHPGFMSCPAVEFGYAPSQKAPAKAEAEEGVNSIDFSPAGDPYSAIGFENQVTNDRFCAAIRMSENDATMYAGNKISSISVYTGCRNIQGGAQRNYIRSCTVFLTYDLQGERILEKKLDFKSQAFTKYSVELDEPFTIEPGKELFIGYEVAIMASNDLPIVIDGLLHSTDDGGWLATYDKTSNKWKWNNVSEYYGFNCISATITGESLPTNAGYVVDMSVPPTSYIDTPFVLQALMRNNASNPVSDIELAYTVGDNETVYKTINIDTPLKYGEEAIVGINGLTYSKPGIGIPVKVDISKVNGVDNTMERQPAEMYMNFFAPGTAFPTTVVSEEFTSIHCGYCPSGIANMEIMKEKYNDGSFILVAVHCPMGKQDPMTASSFSKLSEYYGGGLPGSFINRMYKQTPQDLERYEEYYGMIHGILSPVSISAECALSEDKRSVIINTTSLFGIDWDNSNDNYRLSYVLTEDEVGPYYQSNYYSGGANGPAGGWENLPSSVETYYGDVARYMEGYPGLGKTLPAEIKAMTPIEGTRTITIPSNVRKIENMNVIVYVIDNKENVIVNACKVKSSEIKGNESSAITDIEVDSNENAPVEYFNLQGVRVENPSNGLFIRRQGTDVTKVIL